MVEEVVEEEGVVELGFWHKVVEEEVVDRVGLVEQLEPEVVLGERTGGVCFTG